MCIQVPSYQNKQVLLFPSVVYYIKNYYYFLIVTKYVILAAINILCNIDCNDT